VPTGMKAGVRMTPRGMAISPVRAAPSRAWRWKLKSVAGAGAAGADGSDAVMAREVEQQA
ncbi:MAG: hypothetical protein Q8S58_12955, partial [Bosea sp. (in: a-proteobacteria)]|nr:hypothetical protein [Bosea sp. (in: a-proteobacteria)]